MGFLKSEFLITKNVRINASIDVVWKNLTTCSERNKWSPWYILEPGANKGSDSLVMQKECSESWDGKIVGKGTETVLDVQEKKLIVEMVQFEKPMKSKSGVTFDLEQDGEEVVVTWTMTSELPIFLAFKKKSIQKMVGMDFERGLSMLKELCETGEVNTKSEFKESGELNEFHYIGVKRTCMAEETAEFMPKDFEKLEKLFSNSKIKMVDLPRTIYTKVNLMKGIFTYIVCFPVAEKDAKIEIDKKKFVKGKYGPQKCLRFTHSGSYKFLGNTWTLAYLYPRAHKMKVNNGVPAMEVYLNDPRSTDENKLMTDIFIPLKGKVQKKEEVIREDSSTQKASNTDEAKIDKDKSTKNEPKTQEEKATPKKTSSKAKPSKPRTAKKEMAKKETGEQSKTEK